MVVGFALPERLTGAGQDLIGFPRCCSFQLLEYTTGFLFWTKQNVNVVGHDYQGSQIVKTVFAAVFESLNNQPSHLRMPEKHRPVACSVQVAVHPRKCFSGGSLARRWIKGFG